MIMKQEVASKLYDRLYNKKQLEETLRKLKTRDPYIRDSIHPMSPLEYESLEIGIEQKLIEIATEIEAL